MILVIIAASSGRNEIDALPSPLPSRELLVGSLRRGESIQGLYGGVKVSYQVWRRLELSRV